MVVGGHVGRPTLYHSRSDSASSLLSGRPNDQPIASQHTRDHDHPSLNLQSGSGFEQLSWQSAFQVCVGKAALCLKHGDLQGCRMVLEDARKLLLPPLAAAAMESYMRAYPLLARLHLVQEIESALPAIPNPKCFPPSGSSLALARPAAGSSAVPPHDACHAAAGVGGMKASTAQQPFDLPLLLRRRVREQQGSSWPGRLEATQPNLSVREPLLAARRMLLQLAGGTAGEIGCQWLQLARMNRRAGLYEAAARAVRRGEAPAAGGPAPASLCK